jgi:hypothetical protein
VIVQKLMGVTLAELLQRNSPALGPPPKMFSGSSVSLNHFERVAARAQIRNEAGQNYGKMASRNAAPGCGALRKLLAGGTRQHTWSLHNVTILPPTVSPRQNISRNRLTAIALPPSTAHPWHRVIVDLIGSGNSAHARRRSQTGRRSKPVKKR